VLVQVEYDERGEIRSIAAVVTAEFPDGSKGMSGRIASPGYQMAELDADEVQHARDIAGLKKVKESYRVTGQPHAPRLARK